MWWFRRYSRLADPALGRLGERIGARHLRRLGYRIAARNYRCPLGEVDIIALDQRTLVFVEVKTRRDDRAADPENSVNLFKRRQITAAARHYLSRTSSQDRPCRFDVLAILLRDGLSPEIEHFVNAFGPASPAR